MSAAPRYLLPVQRVDSTREGKPTHWYTAGSATERTKAGAPKRVRLPGVTTLIKGFMPSPGLTYWAANSVAKYVVDHLDELEEDGDTDALYRKLSRVPWEQRDTAAVRGTDVHGLADRISVGEEVVVPDELRPYVDSAVAFLDDWDVEVIASEVCVYNLAHGWAGTLDLIARLADGRTWLLDYKSGKDVYADAVLQLAAYRNGEAFVPLGGGHPVAFPQIDAVGIVHLTPDRYQLYPVEADDAAYRVFRHGLVVAEFNAREEKHREAVRAGRVPKVQSVIGKALKPPVLPALAEEVSA